MVTRTIAALAVLASVAVVPRVATPPPSRVFVCIYEAPPPDPLLRNAHGLAISDDGGATWRSTAWTTNGFTCVATASGTIYLGGDAGLLRSTDDGASWRRVTDRRVPAVLGVRTIGDAVWIATAGGPWKSTDAGAHWNAVSDGLPPVRATYTSDVLRRGDRLLCATDDGVYASSDGSSWQSAGLQGLELSGFASPAPDSDTLVAVAPASGVFWSTDGGTTWHASPTQPAAKKFSAAAFSAGTRELLVATFDAGMLATRNAGRSWEYRNGGLTNYSLTALAVDAADASTVYAGSENGCFVSHDGARTWHPSGIRIGWIGAVALEPHR